MVAWLAESAGGAVAPLVALPLIAGLQNHLQILQHEGAHFNLFHWRALNDLVTDVFCSVPFFGLVSHYRLFHFQHHRHLLDPKRDPEIEFYAEQGYRFDPLTPWEAAQMLAKDLCGYHYFQFFISYHRYLWSETIAGRLPRPKGREGWALALVGLLLLAAGTEFGWGRTLFYWFVPQPTWLFFFLKLQGYGEHRARGETVESCTNDQQLGWFARFFIYPLNSNLHRQHHLRPRARWYELTSSKVG